MTDFFTGVSGDAPPYDPSTLKAPLTTTQRAAILAWLQAYAAVLLATGQATGKFTDSTATPDAQLLKDYTTAASLHGFQTTGITGPSVPSVPNPLSGVEAFLSDLENKSLWIRVAEFTVGGLLLAIGTYGVVKGVSGSNKSPIKTLKKANPVGAATSVL